MMTWLTAPLERNTSWSDFASSGCDPAHGTGPQERSRCSRGALKCILHVGVQHWRRLGGPPLWDSRWGRRVLLSNVSFTEGAGL